MSQRYMGGANGRCHAMPPMTRVSGPRIQIKCTAMVVPATTVGYYVFNFLNRTLVVRVLDGAGASRCCD
jgi:hypothetical protein